jgi:hypothetical protein
MESTGATTRARSKAAASTRRFRKAGRMARFFFACDN